MQKLKNLDKIVLGINLLYIFLVFLNYRDIPNRYTLLAATGLTFFYVLANKKIYLDINTILLGVTLGLYAKLRGFDAMSILMHAALPSMLQLLGKAIQQNGIPKSEKVWICLLPAIVFLIGYSAHGVLNACVFFVEGTIAEQVRYWADVWTRNILPGTQQSIWLLPMIAVMLPAVFCFRKYKVMGSLILIAGIFFLYYSFASLSRVPIMIFGIMALWELGLFLFLNRKNRVIVKKVRKILLVLLGLCLLGLLLILLNWSAIKEIPFVQNLSKDGGILNNVRFRAQRSVLTQLFEYPRGGMPIPEIKMAHNVWLDMAKDTGVITFFLFMVYTIFTLIQVFQLVKSDVSEEMKYLLTGIYFAFFLYYSVEPALNANIQYLVPWTFVNGIICGSNQRMNTLETEKNNVLNKKQRRYLTVKRSLDVILSGAAIIVLSPLLLGISIAIKLDSPGPILFKQKRVGKGKQLFDIWKFRTMRTDTPKDMPTHLLKDPEQYITKTGKFLRKTSLDELPQLFQIFMGDMSVCGPRPALWNQADLVAERDKYGANDITPGLTGWAQINGRDELEIDVKARFDGEYVEKFGFLMDVRCFLGTILSVARSEGVVEGGTGELNRGKEGED